MKYLKILMHMIGGLLLSVNSILAAEEPQFWARYNAPFVPWFLRRNEILIEIE
jgi:hypothetical protein